MIYRASFSTGTIERERGSSRDDLRFAVALVHKETGQIKNVTLSNKPDPRPDWAGVIRPKTKFMTTGQIAKLEAYNKETQSRWSIEVVTLEVKE